MADVVAPFIAFEGIDKCGKGTQTLRAVEALRRRWGNVVFIREPNERDNRTGGLIRRYLTRELPAPANEALQRLFVIDRAVDTVCTILPALEVGRPVVADRFALSTIAYGALTGDAERFVRMHCEILGSWLRWPDLTIVLDITAAEAMRRLEKERGRPELFERRESLERIRTAYRNLAFSHRSWAPDMRIKVVDGDQPVEAVTADVRRILAPYL